MKTTLLVRKNAVATQISAVAALDKADQSDPTPSHKMEKEPKEGQANVAMCTALAAHSRDDSKMERVSPMVNYEFSYPSDEEITPNPKVNFKKTFLARLGHVRSWFRGVQWTRQGTPIRLKPLMGQGLGRLVFQSLQGWVRYLTATRR